MKKNTFTLNLGQSMVELALLLPVLLLIVVVTFDLGRGVYYYSVIYNAAREGARYGIIEPTNYDGIVNAAKEKAIGLNLDEMSVSTLVDNNTIKVSIDYPFELITPMAKLVTECECGIIDLHTSSTMLIER